jgi:hypothetical protein
MRRRVLRLECLEDRVVLSTYKVLTLADNAGTVTKTGLAGTDAHPFLATTLRAAINAANQWLLPFILAGLLTLLECGEALAALPSDFSAIP